jgi:lipopolysaccharide export system protein LptA
MRVTVERLRLAILGLAGVLLVGVLLFFAYARWQIRRIGRDLPGKLGIEIQQSSNGFTFSKSQGGRTLFTLHAAKTVQYKGGGHAILHDVSITLYGAQGGTVDHIYGDDFDYDPVNGIVRADGAVQIDLQVPTVSSAPAAGTPSDASKSTVYVKTAGLTFNEKTGLASTSQRFEFELPQAKGSAVGASFNSTTGELILQSDIALESSLDGNPLFLHAHHAQFDRASRILYLLADETEYAQSRSSSDQAIVYFRPDDSASEIKARGHVTIVGSEGQRITSETAHVSLDLKSQPQQVDLMGGMLYVSNDALRQVHGSASTGTLFFGPGATVQKAHLESTVSIVDDEKPQPQTSPASTPASGSYLSLNREVRAGQLDVDFSSDAARRPIAQRLLATGAASIHIRTLYAATPPEETSIDGDRLLAILQGGAVLSSLQGDGHTKLTMADTKGSTQTSTGDKILLTFAAPSPAKTAKLVRAKTQASTPPPGGQFAPVPLQSDQLQSAQLQSLEQTGHVTVVQTGAASAPAPSRTLTATAERATYDAATQLVRLYGGPPEGDPRVREPDGELTAVTIEFERATGNVTATGQVKATYRQSPAQPGIAFGGAEPIHVVAGRAYVDRAADLTTFYGEANADARLWQGADSISAPVLELGNLRQTLEAHDVAGRSRAKAVTSVFTSADAGPAPKTNSTATQGGGSPVRVDSRSLSYSGVDNKAVFDGGVVAQAPSGTMNANQMEVYLASSATPSSGQNPQQKQTQQVERIVAHGGVQLEQPGRKGTGSQLVYTAQDSRFVLTGTSSLPPRLSDQVHGTVTGTSLIFNDRDDSVIVNGGQSKAVTETRTAK